MSDAISTQGTYISRQSDSSPADYIELAEVKSIGGPNETSEELEVTHLRSTGGYREFIQSFRDAGELPLTLNFLPSNATQQQLRDDYEAGTVTGWKVTFPDGTTSSFSAFVKGIGAPVNVGAVLEMAATLRISGATTWVFV